MTTRDQRIERAASLASGLASVAMFGTDDQLDDVMADIAALGEKASAACVRMASEWLTGFWPALRHEDRALSAAQRLAPSAARVADRLENEQEQTP